MITTTWGISQLTCYPEYQGQPDVVCQVHWTLTADDAEGHTASVYGSVGVDLSDEATFVPYNELTPEIVIGWVKEALGEEQVAEYEAGVVSVLEQQIAPVVVNRPLPWAAEPTAQTE